MATSAPVLRRGGPRARRGAVAGARPLVSGGTARRGHEATSASRDARRAREARGVEDGARGVAGPEPRVGEGERRRSGEGDKRGRVGERSTSDRTHRYA